MLVTYQILGVVTMKKKFLMTTAAAVLSLGVLAACGGAEEDPMLEDPGVEDPADAPMEEPMDEDPAMEEPAVEDEPMDEEPALDETEGELDMEEDMEDEEATN